MFLGLSDKEREALEFVQLPYELKVNLTRLLRHSSNKLDVFETQVPYLVNQNKIVSVAHNVLNRRQYELEAEDGVYYYPAEYGWHYSQIELIFHRGETYQAIEILADLISEELLDKDDVNSLLQRYNIPVEINSRLDSIKVSIVDIEPFEDDDSDNSHSNNLNVLVTRMSQALENNDPSSVLLNRHQFIRPPQYY
ncbi:MAG: hypothetical protein MI749_15290 [Desulfovibrionales bacterium]|nr:hypothetical protein [Desulfovibrionales bacterium]